MSYFFAGRIFNFSQQLIEKALVQPKITKKKEFHLFPETLQYCPLFQIVVKPIEKFLIFLPGADNLKICNLFHKFGIEIFMVKTLSAQILLEKFREVEKKQLKLKDFQNLNDFFSFCEETKLKQVSVFILEGPDYMEIIKKKIKKNTNNSIIYSHFFKTNTEETIDLWGNWMNFDLKTNNHANFSKCILNFNF